MTGGETCRGRSAGRRPWRAAILAPLLVATACSGGRDTRIELVNRLADAEAFTETAVIDVGTPVARRHLLSGWRPGNELWAGRPNESFVWINAATAGVRFFVFEQRDLVLRIRARPNPQRTADAGPLGALLSVNGEPLTRLTIGPGWESYRATIPRQLLAVGENRLAFHFGDDAGRELRLAVDSIELERTIVTYPPRGTLGEAKGLVLPYLSGIWFALEATNGGRFTAQALRIYGPRSDNPGGALEVVVDADGELVRRRFAAGDGITMPIPAGATRIGLLSVPAGDANARVDRRQNEEAVGLILDHPRIVEAAR